MVAANAGHERSCGRRRFVPKTRNSISCRLRLFRKSSIQKGNVHLIGDDVTASDLDRYTFSNAMAHSVKLGTWEALLEEYIDSVEVVTHVSF